MKLHLTIRVSEFQSHFGRSCSEADLNRVQVRSLYFDTQVFCFSLFRPEHTAPELKFSQVEIPADERGRQNELVIFPTVNPDKVQSQLLFVVPAPR